MSPDQKEHGVRWCCLCPGVFNSELLQETLNSNRVYHVQDVQQYLQDHGVMPYVDFPSSIVMILF